MEEFLVAIYHPRHSRFQTVLIYLQPFIHS